MSSGTMVVIVVAVLVVIALLGAAFMAERRRRLRRQFGPEYDRAVTEHGGRMHAEADLAERQRRVRRFDIHPLSAASRNRYRAQWQAIQEEFVDTPQTAVTQAYDLVVEVMQERGYPVTDDEQVADDLSVEHARTVDQFRTAHSITREVAHGSVATEDMRQAVINYRELFSDLLGDSTNDVDDQVEPGRHRAVTSEQPGTGDPEAIDARLGDSVEPGDTGGGKHAAASAPDSTVEPADPQGPPVTDSDMQPQGSARR